MSGVPRNAFPLVPVLHDDRRAYTAGVNSLKHHALESAPLITRSVMATFVGTFGAIREALPGRLSTDELLNGSEDCVGRGGIHRALMIEQLS